MAKITLNAVTEYRLRLKNDVERNECQKWKEYDKINFVNCETTVTCKPDFMADFFHDKCLNLPIVADNSFLA